jgi:hypothetical protein
MVAVNQPRVSIDEDSATARVEVSTGRAPHPLVFSVGPSSCGRGWDVRDPLGGAFAWRAVFRGAGEDAVATPTPTLHADGAAALAY